MRKLFISMGLAAAFALASFGFTPAKHTNVLTRAGVTYVQRGALGAGDYVVTNMLGGSVAVLHYNSATTNFTETAKEVVYCATNGCAVKCLYNGAIWLDLQSVVTSTMSGYPAFMLTFHSPNASASAGGIASPLFLSAYIVPDANFKYNTAGYYKLLADGYTSLTNSANFRAAVQAVGGGGVELPDDALILTNAIVKTVGGTELLPSNVNAFAASEFARPWKKWRGYSAYDTVSYGGKVWVCGHDFDGEETFNESGYWIDLVSTVSTDRSWLKWHKDWLWNNYAPRGEDASFDAVSATSVTAGNLYGSLTVNSGKTLAIQNGGTFTIGGSNYTAVVDSQIDAKVAVATNAVAGQIHRITATDGSSAVDGDLGIYDTNGWDYVCTLGDTRLYQQYAADGSPYWFGTYSGTDGGVAFRYDFTLTYLGSQTWRLVCPQIDLDRTSQGGDLTSDATYIPMPLRYAEKSPMSGMAKHGTITPNYRKVAGKPLTGDVTLGTLTINGQTYDGSADKTITIQGLPNHALVLTNNAVKTYGGTAITPSQIGAASSDDLSDKLNYYGLNYSQASSTGGFLVWSSVMGYDTLKLNNATFEGIVKPTSLHSSNDYEIEMPDKAGTMALTSDISSALTSYVPTSRKINGQALTQDITIQSMDYQAVTNTVNAVKAEFYDEPLSVNWTVRMVNGEMKLYATTNVDMSVLSSGGTTRYTQWSTDNLPSEETWAAQPYYDEGIDLWEWAYDSGTAQSEEGGADATTLTFGYGAGFTTTRSVIR